MFSSEALCVAYSRLSCGTVAMVDGPYLKVLALQCSVGQINKVFPRNTKLYRLLILLTYEAGLDLNVSHCGGQQPLVPRARTETEACSLGSSVVSLMVSIFC